MFYFLLFAFKKKILHDVDAERRDTCAVNKKKKKKVPIKIISVFNFSHR